MILKKFVVIQIRETIKSSHKNIIFLMMTDHVKNISSKKLRIFEIICVNTKYSN